ncbi:hypothetical protein AK88_03471 [Plasmodium fragile]|uniref:Uncharacterized protein n=1 Tax=Plasmodium fragile TaxID=5857 RepID=A0A0D9QMA1_PLAFR|nr:uncharacterized protein AK88_03471 [Plasmodium fragile]KJP86861.1 hypothetical protein AK88_03471 [Plasmodium fragile]
MIHNFSLRKMNSVKNQMVPAMLEMQTAQVAPVHATSNNTQMCVGKEDINNIYLDILNIHDSIVNHLQTITIQVYNMVEQSILSSCREDSCKELHTGGAHTQRTGPTPMACCINVTNDEGSDSARGGVVSFSNGSMRTQGQQPCTHVDTTSHVKIETAEGNNSSPSEHENVGHGRMQSNEVDRLVNSLEQGMMDPTQHGRINNTVNTYMHGECNEREENIPSSGSANELKCSNELAKMTSNYDAPVELIINKIEPKGTKREMFHEENTHKGDQTNVEQVIKENKLNLRKHIVLMELLKYVLVHSNNSQADLHKDKIVNSQMRGNNDMHKLKRDPDFLKMNLNSGESICCDQNFSKVDLSSINIKYLNIISYYMDLLSPFNKFHGEKRAGDGKCAPTWVDADDDVDGREQLTLVRKKLDDLALNYDDLVEDILQNNNVNGFTESYLYALKDKILQGEFTHEVATGMPGGDPERLSRILLSDLKRQPNGNEHSGLYVTDTSIGSGAVLDRHTPYSHFSHAVASGSERPNEDFLRSVNPFPGGNIQMGEVPNWAPSNGSKTSMATLAHRPGRNNPIGQKAVHHNICVPKGYTFTEEGGALYSGRRRSGDENLNAYDNMMCDSAQSYHHLYNNNDGGSTSNHISSTDMNYAHVVGAGLPGVGVKHLVKQISKEHTENSKKPIFDDTMMNYDPYSAPTMYIQESNFNPQDKYNKNAHDPYGQYYKGGYYYAGGKEGFINYPGNFKNGLKMEGKGEYVMGGSENFTCAGQNYSNDTHSGDLWGYRHHVGSTLHEQGRDHYDANDPRRLSPGTRIIPHGEQNQDVAFACPPQRNIKNGTKLKFVDGVAGGEADARGMKHLEGDKSGEDEEDNSNTSHPPHAQSGNSEVRHHHHGDSRRGAEKTYSKVRSNKCDSSYYTNDKHFFSANPSFDDWANDEGAYAHGFNANSGNLYSGGEFKRTMFDGQFYMQNKGGEQMDNAFLNRDKDSSMRKMPTSSFVELHHTNGKDILGTQLCDYLCRSNSLSTYNRPSSSFSLYAHRLRDGLPSWDQQNHNSRTNGGTNYTCGKNRQSNDEQSNGRHNNDTDGRGSNNGGRYRHSGGGGNNGVSRSNESGSNDNDGDEDKNGDRRHRGRKDYYDDKEDEEEENENDGRGKDHCADHTNQHTLQNGGEKRTNNQRNNSENAAHDPNAHSLRNEGVESFLQDHQLMESNIDRAKYKGHGNSSGAPNRVGVQQSTGVAGGANRTSRPSQSGLPDSATLGSSCNFIPFGGQVSFPDPANYGHYGGFENFANNYGGYTNFGDRSYGSYSNCGNFCSSYSRGRDGRGDRVVGRSALTHSSTEASDELRIRTGAGCPVGPNDQVQFHNQGNKPIRSPMSSPMKNEMYAPNSAGERNRRNSKPRMEKMVEKNESMEHDLMNFTNSAYVDIHKIIRNDDLLKNELSGLEESLKVANAETKGGKKNTAKYNSNELEILMMYDSCKSMLKSCNMLRSEELKNTDGDEYLVNEKCIPANVLTNSDMMSDSLNADIEKIIDIMSTNMQVKSKDKKRKLSSISCPPNDRTFPNGEKKAECVGDKCNSKKMPRNSEDKRKKYQKMDIRTLNKNVQKNKEVCKNCYIHYDNSKCSYILTFINRKQKKQRKLFPVNPSEKDEAYVIQIMNYIEKLKEQEKIFGISKNDEMGALQRGEAANLQRSEGGKSGSDRRNYDKDQQGQKKHMASEPYAEGHVPKKNEMCSTNLNLLNKKMNNFLSGINDQMYMDPQMNFIPEQHLPFVQNVGGNPNVNHVNLYDDVNTPSGVDYMNFNLLNDGNSFENLHLMNPCTNSVQNLNPFFKMHSKKGDFSTQMNDQYVGDVMGEIARGEVSAGGGDSVHGGVATDINNNSSSCRNITSGMNNLEGRRGNRGGCQVSGGSHNRGSPFTPNVYENAMMHQTMKNVMYQGDNNQAINHQKARSSGSPTNPNDQFSPMNIFTNPNFSNYNQSNMANSCESEMIHNYNSVMNEYGDSMLVDSTYDSDRVAAGGRTMQNNE